MDFCSLISTNKKKYEMQQIKRIHSLLSVKSMNKTAKIIILFLVWMHTKCNDSYLVLILLAYKK